MFLSKKSVILPIALSILVIAPAFAKKPETFLGKVGTSILQTINEHPFLTSAALSTANLKLLQFKSPETFKEDLYQFLIIAPITLAETTLIKALTKNFEVDSIQ